MCGGTDPHEDLHCCEKGRRDDGIQGPNAGVRDEVGDEPSGQVGCVHCDEQVDRVRGGEMEDFLAIGGDLQQGSFS